MQIAYTPEQEQLRDELRSYYDTLLTDDVRASLHEEVGCGPVTRKIVKQMAGDGWLGIGWPTEYGGQGRSQIEQFIFFDESMRCGAPVPMLTINTVGPTIMQFGTQEQKDFFLPKILAGDLHFCIGYSENQAGTDLAALKTKAVRDGDEYVINGQKMWTSLASDADYCWLAVRTDPDAPKHKGISMIIVDMKTPGITVDPLHLLSSHDINATFYDDVRVPAGNLVGGENNGWGLIMNQLNHERVTLCSSGLLEQSYFEVCFTKDIEMSSKHHRVVIIGSGPAGLTAALYAARANLKPVIFEGLQPGGQLTITTEVENYPGFPDGIMGPELMDIMRKQAARFGAVSLYENIAKVDLSKRPFRLWSDSEEYSADAVIVATGATAKWLGITSEVEYRGYGVSACATCDGFFFKGLEVVVVGGGDTAIEEATFLSKFATKVTIIHRRESLRASKIMQEKAQKNPKIAFVWDSVIEEILGKSENGKKTVTGVRLRNVKTGTTTNMRTDGVFMGIGHQPNTELFIGQLDTDAHGYILTEGKGTATKIPGVFVAGDVADSVYRQAISAAGTGCMAAIDAERWLESQGTD